MRRLTLRTWVQIPLNLYKAIISALILGDGRQRQELVLSIKQESKNKNKQKEAKAPVSDKVKDRTHTQLSSDLPRSWDMCLPTFHKQRSVYTDERGERAVYLVLQIGTPKTFLFPTLRTKTYENINFSIFTRQFFLEICLGTAWFSVYSKHRSPACCPETTSSPAEPWLQLSTS